MLAELIENEFIEEKINKIYFSDIKFQSIFTPKNINFNGEGKYSFNNLEFLKINFSNNLKNNEIDLKLNFDFRKSLKVDF